MLPWWTRLSRGFYWHVAYARYRQPPLIHVFCWTVAIAATALLPFLMGQPIR